MREFGFVGKQEDGTQILRCAEGGHLWLRAPLRGPGPARCPNHRPVRRDRRRVDVTTDPRVAVAVRLAAEGWSLRQIGRVVGVSGECVRLWLNAVGVAPEVRGEIRHRKREAKERAEREREEAKARKRNAKCLVCGKLLGPRRKKTCSHECAVAWPVLRTRTEEGRRRHRDAIARSVLKHPEGKSKHAVEWAKRHLAGEAKTRGTWFIEGSFTQQVAQKYWGGEDR